MYISPTLRYVTLCNVILRYVTLCNVTLRYVISKTLRTVMNSPQFIILIMQMKKSKGIFLPYKHKQITNSKQSVHLQMKKK